MIDGINIVGLQKTSVIDFPGMVSTVVFLSGCNLRCPYCYNAGVVLGEYEPISYSDVREHLIKRKGIIEGVVVTGGEPTLHKGLKNLCDDLRQLGFKIKLDTNGLEPETITECDIDYLALDIKTSFEKYSLLNVSQSCYDYRERLGMSVDIAKKMGDRAEVRITAVPNIISYEDLDSLTIELRGVSKVFIQNFAPCQTMLDARYLSITPYAQSELKRWRDKLLSANINAQIREE